MTFDKCKHSCNHHPNHSIQWFPHPQEMTSHPSAFDLLQYSTTGKGHRNEEYQWPPKSQSTPEEDNFPEI